MIVTIRGAYKNAGDHLIGKRASALLARHVDSDVVSIDRRAITDESYDVMNRARAVLLTGGPAYQKAIYPGVYSFDLDRISVPVVPFGLGWKSRWDDTPSSFSFTPEARDFVLRVHADQGINSSARCGLTADVLHGLGISNVLMTGCPAWYDETNLDVDYVFPSGIKRLVITAPARPHSDIIGLARYLAKRFPRAEKYLAYQSGYRSPRRSYTLAQMRTIARARLLGFQPISFEGDVEKLSSFLSSIDLHVGYRVHSHIYCLSKRVTSVLFAEDSRAVGQAAALGSPVLSSSASVEEKVAEIDRVLATKGHDISTAVSRIRETHPVMLQYLSQF